MVKLFVRLFFKLWYAFGLFDFLYCFCCGLAFVSTYFPLWCIAVSNTCHLDVITGKENISAFTRLVLNEQTLDRRPLGALPWLSGQRHELSVPQPRVRFQTYPIE